MGSSFTPTDQDIHKELLRRCASMLDQVRLEWRSTHIPEAAAMAWVSEEIQDDHGRPINNTVMLELPDDRASWVEVLTRFVKRTKAFGLFIIERRSDEVKGTFESRLGTRTWRLKKERHGDVDVLSRPTVHDNAESMGLLWRG